MGVTIDEILVADPPEAWEAAGFAVDGDGTCRVGHVRIGLVGRGRGKRILGWSLRDVVPGTLADGPADGGGERDGDTSLDGLATTASERDPVEPAVHPNGTLLLDHLVLATPDVARTTAALERAGLAARRTRHTDTYGAPFVQTFFRAGEVIVELIGPEEPGGDGPAGFFGLAFTVADLDATAAVLGPALGATKDAVQPGRRIGTLRHRDLGMSVATAFMSPEPAPGAAPVDGADAT